MIVVTGTTVACASQNLQRAGTGNRAGVVATIGSQHEPFRLEAQPTIGVLVACPKKRMRVRLIKKLAEVIDGIDLTAVKAGDVLNLERSEAQLLIVEGWAVLEDRVGRREHVSEDSQTRAIAADRPR